MGISADIEKLDDKLSDDDLRRLILEGRDEEVVLLPIKELSRRKSPARVDIFRQVLDDPKQVAGVKKTVATQLGTEFSPASQEVLLRQIDTPDPSLFVVVTRSLGKIGDEHALRTLEGQKAPADRTASAALEFAKSLIAYRLRLNTHLIAIPPEAKVVSVTAGISFESKNSDPDTTSKALQQAKKDLPAIPLAQEGAARLDCRDTKFLLAFTDDFYGPNMLQSLKERSAVPLVLLKDNLSLERYFLDRYFFTHPSDKDGEILVRGTRPKGDLTFVGDVRVSETAVTFTLNTLESPYAPPVEIVGTYSPQQRSWKFEKALTGTRVAARNGAIGTPRRATPNFR
jgi:hypothetical protein